MKQESAYLQEENTVHPRARTSVHAGGRTGILLIHGFAGSTNDLAAAAAHFRAQGHSVVNIRLAGHGTAPEDLEQQTEKDWAASASEGLALLRKHADRFVLFGFSFGGNLAIDLLLREPQSVQGLVLVAMPIRIAGEQWKRFFLPLAQLFGKRFFTKSWARDLKKAEEYRRSGKYTVVPVRAFRRFLAFISGRTKPQLFRVRVPALMIYGTRDYAVDPSSAEYARAHLGSKKKELYWVTTDSREHHLLRSGKQEKIYEKLDRFIAACFS
jgi:carboxylesterase